MVQLYLNNQECDLYGNETIATDYSIAPIGNISTRSSSRSISFKLPLTANNRAIIENANVIVNSTTLPYRLIPAQLKANGLDQNLEFASIESIKDEISVRLFGNNIDFFSIIKGKKMADLGDVFDHEWNLGVVFASRNNTSGFIYAMIDFHSDSPNAEIGSTLQIDVRALLPSVFLHSLISEIITQAGFTAEGDFLNDANYKSVLIPCTSLDLGRYEAQLLASASSSAITNLVSDVSFDTTISDPLGLFQNQGGFVNYTAMVDGSYTFRLNVSWFDYLAGSPTITVKRNSDGSWIRVIDVPFHSGANTFGSLELEFTVDLAAGDFIYVEPFDSTGNLRISAGAIMEVIDADAPHTKFGFAFDVTSNLGGYKQSDLLKDTAEKFGLIFQVNNVTRTVHIRRFSEIIANKPIAKDWSNKVDYTDKPEIKFDSDYARKNLCIYTEDDTVIKPPGTDSEILIDNDKLDAEKELFESPFAASEQVERFGSTSIAQIKLFTDFNGADESIGSVEPRYLILRHVDFSLFTYTDHTTADLTTVTVPVTHFILPDESFNAGFANNLLDYSAELIALIQQFKTVTMLLRITAADINQLDFFIPVWIELNGQPGCYFYISVIKQFKVTSKESTEVELVKINT